MKPLSIAATLFLMSSWSAALDTLLPLEEWQQYQKSIVKERMHEQPVWERPSPGHSPVVVIQTLILPQFNLENASLELAFDVWQEDCRRNGANVKVYLDPAILRNRPLITHSAVGDTAAKALSIIEANGVCGVKLANDHFLAGIHDNLDPHGLHFRSWVLSEEAAGVLALHQSTRPKSEWCAVEDRLQKLGAAFPSGTYADFNPEIRALVVINTSVTIDALSELIIETEAQVTVRHFMDKGVVQMDGYELEVRSNQLRRESAVKISARLKDSSGRLVPFAASTDSWAKSRGFMSPAGGAVWLDLESSTLWLRSRPDFLDEFMKQLRKAESSP